MVCISLGYIDKTIILIIIGCIFCFLDRLLSTCKSRLYQSVILSNYCIAFSRFLTIIPFLIVKIKSLGKNKRNNMKNIKENIDENKDENNKLIELIYTDIREEEVVYGKWRFILLSTFTYLSNAIFMALAIKIKTNSWIWYILFAAVFHYFIFKVKLYMHHYLSIILIIILGLVIDFVSGNIQKELTDVRILYKFLKDIFTALYMVFAKYTIEKNCPII